MHPQLRSSWLVARKMDQEKKFRNWEEFEEAIITLESKYNKDRNRVLYRGQRDAAWKLDTTLERRTNTLRTIEQYYHVIRVIQPELTTFTGQKWKTPKRNDIGSIARSGGITELEEALRGDSYPYLAYLRHHGFPSPLLDWTGSPYVASYFAFANATAENIAVFAFVEMPERHKDVTSRNPMIVGLGPRVEAHKRHFRQQSRYTVCVQRDKDTGWRFAPHQNVFDLGREDQDLLWKFVIPSGERIKALKKLERYNLNAFSLFDTEESLLETLGIRMIDLDQVN